MEKKDYPSIKQVLTGIAFIAATAFSSYYIGKRSTERKLRSQIEDLLNRIKYLENGIVKKS